MLRSADTYSIRRAAERRRIVRDIRRTTRDHTLPLLLKHEYGGLTRDACNCTVEVNIRHHIPDDEDRRTHHRFECIYHGVNSHLTFHESCCER